MANAHLPSIIAVISVHSINALVQSVLMVSANGIKPHPNVKVSAIAI